MSKESNIVVIVDSSDTELIDITSTQMENLQYFLKDSHGPAYIVLFCQYHLKTIYGKISLNHIILQMKFAKPFRNLHHTKVIERIHLVAHLQTKNADNNISSKWELKIPVTYLIRGTP